MKDETKNAGRRIGLSFLRVTACLMVFTVHFGQRMSVSGKLRDISDCGKWGVQLFFVLSGFLACISWFSSYDCDKPFSGSIKTYYKKRLIRIMPLYYFCIIYYYFTETFIWGSIPPDKYGLYWVRYIIPLNGVIPEESYFWSNLGITWTIPVFLLFYLLFPFFVKWFNSIKRSVILYIISMVIAYCINHFMNGFLSSFAYLNAFILGICAYYATKSKSSRLFVLLASFIVLCSLFRFIDKEYGISAVFALIVYSFNYIQCENHKIQKVFFILDEHSYTVYLIHGIVFCGIIDKVNVGRPFTAIIAIFGTTVLSFIVHKFYEKPIVNALNSIRLKKTAK